MKIFFGPFDNKSFFLGGLIENYGKPTQAFPKLSVRHLLSLHLEGTSSISFSVKWIERYIGEQIELTCRNFHQAFSWMQRSWRGNTWAPGLGRLAELASNRGSHQQPSTCRPDRSLKTVNLLNFCCSGMKWLKWNHNQGFVQIIESFWNKFQLFNTCFKSEDSSC